MIPAGVRVPCQADPTTWDLPESVAQADDVEPARAHAAAALHQCRHQCPAVQDCYQTAAADPPQHQIAGGVIWGTSRTPLHWKVWRPPIVGRRQPCGTRAGAVTHRANDEPVDDACRDAERTYWRNHKRRRNVPTGRAT